VLVRDSTIVDATILRTLVVAAVALVALTRGRLGAPVRGVATHRIFGSTRSVHEASHA
jgi:hypothetical protein